MSKYGGRVETRRIDRLLTSEELDADKRRALQGFRDRMDRTILEANTTVLRQKLPRIDIDVMTRIAVRIAELRASYLSKAMSLAEKPGVPTVEALEDLHRHRVAFEELLDAYEALERVIERGYTNAV